MTVTVDLKTGKLFYNDTDNNLVTMGVSCRVRTLANGQRTKAVKDVRHTIPGGYPYDPAPFPSGKWNIIGVEWIDHYLFDKWEYGTVKIRTDAKQLVETWMCDSDGNYLRPTGNKVWDEGYLIHYSSSSTTLGCIRADNQVEVEQLAKAIEVAAIRNEAVELVVL